MSIESKVIADMLMSEGARSLAFEVLRETDFLEKDAKTFFRTMKEFDKNDKPISYFALVEHLMFTIDQVAAVDLPDEAETVPKFYKADIDTLLERNRMKSIRSFSTSLTNMAQGGYTSDEIVSSTLALLEKMSSGLSSGSSLIGKNTGAYFENKMEMSRSAKNMMGLSTGFPWIDKMFSGLCPDTLYILAARPSTGKSSLALQIALHVARELQENVLFFSQEMPEYQMLDRICSIYGDLDHFQVRNAYLNEDRSARMLSALNMIDSIPLHMDYTPNVSCAKIKNEARIISTKTKKPIGLIVVDTLNKMQLEPGQSKADRVGATSAGLETISKVFNCPVLALCQLNRELLKRPDPIPIMSDLKDSGDIEQNAGGVIFLHREEDAELTIAKAGKNRNGPTGQTNLTFQGKYVRFVN